MAFSLFSPELSRTVSQIHWQAVYLVGLVVVVVLIGYHAMITQRHAGKTPETPIFALTSLLEGLWLLVSGLVLYYGHFDPVIKTAPVAYVIYCVFGWGYGLYLLQDEVDTIKNIDDIVMPTAYLQYSKAFSLVMTLVAVMMLSWLWFLGKFLLPF